MRQPRVGRDGGGLLLVERLLGQVEALLRDHLGRQAAGFDEAPVQGVGRLDGGGARDEVELVVGHEHEVAHHRRARVERLGERAVAQRDAVELALPQQKAHEVGLHEEDEVGEAVLLADDEQAVGHVREGGPDVLPAVRQRQREGPRAVAQERAGHAEAAHEQQARVVQIARRRARHLLVRHGGEPAERAARGGRAVDDLAVRQEIFQHGQRHRRQAAPLRGREEDVVPEIVRCH